MSTSLCRIPEQILASNTQAQGYMRGAMLELFAALREAETGNVHLAAISLEKAIGDLTQAREHLARAIKARGGAA